MDINLCVQLTRFTGIFFGDFYTGGGTDILGGLAVQGNMHAPNYVVNANHVRYQIYYTFWMGR